MTAQLSPQTEALIERLLARFAPPARVPLTEWAETHRYLAQGTKRPGPYRVAATPYLRGIQEAVTYALTGIEPRHAPPGRPREIVVQKSAQVGYTEGVVLNTLGWAIDSLRVPAMGLFAKEAAAREFASEKLEPMIAATECLAEVVSITSRARGESTLHRSYPGGFLKLVGSRSPTNVKSSPLPLVVVEEPDDTERDVRGQGDAITLAEQRLKSFQPDALLLIGGTPTVKGVSVVATRMALTDCREYHVPCHECGHAEPLRWQQVTWQHDESARHPVYGTALPDSAAYACPGCGVLWTDHQRVRNVARADELQQAGEPGVGWVAHGAFDGRAGFALNELLSAFEASRLPQLVRRQLEARAEYDQGKPEKLISFTNNTLGEAWEHKSDTPPAEKLAERSEAYTPGTVPHGGACVVAGVDVQHNRLHLHLWAVGRGEESWLVGRHIIPGNPTDKADPVWDALAERLAAPLKHATGATLHVAAFGVDSSDGGTQDAVYGFIRAWRHRRQPDGSKVKAMALKGAGARGPGGRRTRGGRANAEREIYTAPRPLDRTGRDKASRYGLQLHIVGVDRAKDSLAARLKLLGTGPGRVHWYATVEPEFFAGITAEIKIPGARGRMEWVVKSGQANEDTDCAVYAMHAWHALRAHVWTEQQWRVLETRLQHFERDLVQQADDHTEAGAEDHPAPPPPAPPPPPTARRAPRRAGWMSGYRR